MEFQDVRRHDGDPREDSCRSPIDGSAPASARLRPAPQVVLLMASLFAPIPVWRPSERAAGVCPAEPAAVRAEPSAAPSRRRRRRGPLSRAPSPRPTANRLRSRPRPPRAPTAAQLKTTPARSRRRSTSSPSASRTDKRFAPGHAGHRPASDPSTPHPSASCAPSPMRRWLDSRAGHRARAGEASCRASTSTARPRAPR